MVVLTSFKITKGLQTRSSLHLLMRVRGLNICHCFQGRCAAENTAHERQGNDPKQLLTILVKTPGLFRAPSTDDDDRGIPCLGRDCSTCGRTCTWRNVRSNERVDDASMGGTENMLHNYFRSTSSAGGALVCSTLRCEVREKVARYAAWYGLATTSR